MHPRRRDIFSRADGGQARLSPPSDISMTRHVAVVNANRVQRVGATAEAQRLALRHARFAECDPEEQRRQARAALDAVQSVRRVAFAPRPTAAAVAEAWERKAAGTSEPGDEQLLRRTRSEGVPEPDFRARVILLAAKDDAPPNYSAQPSAKHRLQPARRARQGEPPNPRGNPVRVARETSEAYAAAVFNHCGEVYAHLGSERAIDVLKRLEASHLAVPEQCTLVDEALLGAMATDIDHVYAGGHLAYRCGCNALRKGWACHLLLLGEWVVAGCGARHKADLARAQSAESACRAQDTDQAADGMTAQVSQASTVARHDPTAPASYTSTCILLYGYSRLWRTDVVLLIRNPNGRVEPISESREQASDNSVATTAMRGIAEEVLGTSKAEPPTFKHGQTYRLLRRLDESGILLRHLGRSQDSTHRSYALRADHLFDDAYGGDAYGVDNACARFRTNDEALGVILAPLRGLTGASGETQVADVEGKVWKLRGDRHLGERRVQAAKADMSELGSRPPDGAAQATAGDATDDITIGAAQAAVEALRAKGVTAAQAGSCSAAQAATKATQADAAQASSNPTPELQAPEPDCSISHTVQVVFHSVHPSIQSFRRGKHEYGLVTLGAGRIRVGGMDDFIPKSMTYLPLDLLRGKGMDLEHPPVRMAVGERITAGDITGMHISTNCATYSPALCLSQDGGPPIGQYRSAEAPRGKATLNPATLKRCEADSKVRDNALALALQLHHRGGSVSIESSPDCKDRDKPWFRSGNGYDTAQHFSYWDGEDMQEYIRTTESVFVTLPRCATVGADEHPGYQKYMTFLLNPTAARRAGLLRTFEAKGCKHGRGEHTRLRGNDVDGVSHSRKAEEYPPALCRAVVALHHDRRPPSETYPALAVAVPNAGGEVMDIDSTASGGPGKRPGEEPQSSTGGASGKRRRQLGAQAFLVCLVECATNPRVLLRDGLLPELDVQQGLTGAVRTSAKTTAQAALPALFPEFAHLPIHYAALRGESPNHEHILAIFARVAPTAASGWTAVRAKAVSEPQTRARVMAAVGLVGDIYGDGSLLAGPEGTSGAIIGRLGYTAVAETPSASQDGARRFEGRRQRDVAQTLELQRHLTDEARRQASSGDLDMAGYLDEIIPNVRPAPAAEVSGEVRGTTKTSPSWLLYERFRLTHIEPSASLPRPRAQTAPAGFQPACKADLLTTDCIRQIETWFDGALQWMLSFVHPGEEAAPPRPETLVIGQEGFLPQAKGCVWDCRRERDGVIVPLDVTTTPASDWNREWLAEQLQDYPCKETISHICEGADLKADLPLSFCFTPHLFSIADKEAYASAYKDLLKLKAKGWYEWFTDVPFAPWGTSGQGTRPKPPDPVTGNPRHRRIVSGSDPYDPLAGADGVFRMSVNAATKAPYPPTIETPFRRLWRRAGLVIMVTLLLRGAIRQVPNLWRSLARFRKERKPRLLDVAHDLSIMAAIGEFAGVPLFIFIDDFATFFYQFRLASRCLWYSGIVMLDPELRRLWYIVEGVMAMGFSPSSNIAQMGGEAFLYIFDALMGEADEIDRKTERKLHAVMEERRRRHGAAQARPRRRWIYTDDTLHAVLGTRRMVQAYMKWRLLLRTARIMAAEMQKRQLGTHGIYLGARLMVALGYVNVAETKLLKATTRMTTLLSGELDKDTARRLFGLLVHLVFLDASLRATTAGLWRSVGRARADPVQLTEREAARAQRWLALLQRAAAVAMNAAVRRLRRRIDVGGGLTLVGQSDACREQSVGYAGLGGYSHGTAWRLVLPPRAVEILPNSANEYLAFLVHLLVNQAAHAMAACVLHALDNMNAALAAARDSAKAPIMLAIYDEMIRLPAYQAVSGKLLTAHWFGERLRLADAASRGDADVLREVTSALRIRLVMVEPPPTAGALVRRILDAQERLLQLESPQPRTDLPSHIRVLTSVERHTAIEDAGSLGDSASHRPCLQCGQPFKPVACAKHIGRLTRSCQRCGPTGATRGPASSLDITVAPLTATARKPTVTEDTSASVPLRLSAPRRYAPVQGEQTKSRVSLPKVQKAPPLRIRPPDRQTTARRGGGDVPGLATAVARRLHDDSSSFALRPKDPAVLDRLGIAVHGYAELGANADTVRNERSALRKYWAPWVARLGTPYWRTDEAQRDPQREALLQTAFVIDTWQTMKPRSKSDAVARVQSAFNVLGHVRRAHSRKGYTMPPPAMLSHVFKGMNKEMLLNYGKYSQLPVRAEPFTADQNVRMLTIQEGTMINGRPYCAAAPFWRGWRLVDTFATQTGERKAGIMGHELGGYTRADVYIILDGGEPIGDPSPTDLRAVGRTRRDYVLIRGGPAKADVDGRFFGPTPMVFTLDRANAANFAAALVDFELAFPCRGSARNGTPLFTQDGRRKAWTASAIDRTLDGVMAATLTPAERQHKTFHSKRVWLASALTANKLKDGEIQALCRWRSTDSIRIYGRMDMAYQARCREAACSARFSALNATSLIPIVDPIRYGTDGAPLLPTAHEVEVE